MKGTRMTHETKLVIDIETGPLPDDELQRLVPEFELMKVAGAKHLGEFFDSANVKTGNIKDAQKIIEKIEQKRREHAQEQADLQLRIEEARSEYFAKFKEKAPLHAHLGQILAAGYSNGTNTSIDGSIDGGDEGRILIRWWDVYDTCEQQARSIIGFNIFGFDLPFLCRRSWLLGIPVPFDVFDRGRWHPIFIDLAEVWRLRVPGEYISLDTLAKAFRIGSKPDGISGADFHKLWHEDHEAAEAYLKNDLAMTRALAVRLGVITEE